MRDRTALFAACLLAACLLAACAGPPAPERDGGAVVDSTGQTDVAADVGSSGEWGAPRPLVALNTSAHERFAAPGRDGLTILFARTEQSGGFSVNRPYVARRSTVCDPFDPPARAAAFGDISIHDFELSSDGLEWLYWKGLGQLARSTRADAESPWSPPEELGFDGLSPSLSADGLSLYYLGVGDVGLIARRRASRSAPWGQPRAILIPDDRTPISIDIAADELALLVVADTRLPGGGVFIARRSSTGDDFGPLEPIPTLAGAFESARFGNDDRLVAVTDSRGSNRELAIAQKH